MSNTVGDLELEPVVAIAQGELQPGLQVIQGRSGDAGQVFGDAVVLDAPEDAGAESMQPGLDLGCALGVDRDERPDPAGGAAQEQPAQGLAGVEIDLLEALEVIDQEQDGLGSALVGVSPAGERTDEIDGGVVQGGEDAQAVFELGQVTPLVGEVGEDPELDLVGVVEV